MDVEVAVPENRWYSVDAKVMAIVPVAVATG